MTFQIILLALLLCAEAPGESVEGRRLVAETVTYRMEQRGQFLEQVIFGGEYCGAAIMHKGPLLLDPRTRRWEWMVNLAIARRALQRGNNVAVSHFHQRDVKPYWARPCRVVRREGVHIFYLCGGKNELGKG